MEAALFSLLVRLILRMNPLEEINDPVAAFFRALGYTVTWDANKSTRWYEILADNQIVCQIDIGPPLADIVEDLTQLAAGRPGTSKSDYVINVGSGDTEAFDRLCARVVESQKVVA